MGIRQFESNVFPVGDGTWVIQIQTPLTRCALRETDKHTPAFLTEIGINRSWTTSNVFTGASLQEGRSVKPFVVRRTSTYINPSTGLRLLKNGPVTTDTVDVFTQQLQFASRTVWTESGKLRRSRIRDSHHITSESSNEPFDFIALADDFMGKVHGLKDTRMAQPFVDWLMETFEPLAKLFNEAGWLPDTIAALNKVKSLRDKAHNDALWAMKEAQPGPDIDDEWGDRWR